MSSIAKVMLENRWLLHVGGRQLLLLLRCCLGNGDDHVVTLADHDRLESFVIVWVVHI